MKIVVDANVFFALMKPDSVASAIFSMTGFKFFAPWHITSDLKEHTQDCLSKSRLSKNEFEIRLAEIEERITFSDLAEYKRFLKKALDVLPDSEDAPYLALAVSLKAVIWSNDPDLKKQSLVKVYTTKELIDALLKAEITE